MGFVVSNISPALGAVHKLDTVPTVTIQVDSNNVFPVYRTLNTIRLTAVIYKNSGNYYEWLIYDGVIQPGWTGSITPIDPFDSNIVKGYYISLVRDANWRTPNTTGDGYASPLLSASGQDSLSYLCDPGDIIRFNLYGDQDTGGGYAYTYGNIISTTSPEDEVWRMTLEEITLTNLSPVDSTTGTGSQNMISGLTFTCDLVTDSLDQRDFIDLSELNVSAQVRHVGTGTIYTEPVLIGGVFSAYWAGSITDLINGYHLTLTRNQVWSQGFTLLGEPARLATHGSNPPEIRIALSMDVKDTAFYLHSYRFGSYAATYPDAFDAYYYTAYQAAKQWRRILTKFQLRVISTSRDPTQHEYIGPTDTAVIFDVQANIAYPFTVDDIEIFIFPDGAIANTSELCYTSGGGFSAPWTGSSTSLGSNKYRFSFDRNQDWNVGPSVNFPSTVPITGIGTVGAKVGVTINGDFAQTLYFGSVIPATLTNPEDDWSWTVTNPVYDQTINTTGLTSAELLGLLHVYLFEQYINPAGIDSNEALGTFSFLLLDQDITLSSLSSVQALGTTTTTRVEAELTPKTSSFRGGAEVLLHTIQKLTDSSLDHDFHGQTLPAGWSTSLLGTGSRIRHNLNGTVLTTGPVAGSHAHLYTGALHAECSATLYVRPLTPNEALTSPVTCLVFSFKISETSYATLRVRRNKLISTSSVIVDSVIQWPTDVLIGGSITLAPDQDLALQIVRAQNYVFLLVNGTQIASTSRFASSGSGAFDVLVTNEDENTQVSTRIEKLEVRSHVIVAGRLLLNKVDIGERRVFGTVPAATLADVGKQDIILFGPWGSVRQVAAFEYTRSDSRHIGSATGTSLTSYVDPAIKD